MVQVEMVRGKVMGVVEWRSEGRWEEDSEERVTLMNDDSETAKEEEEVEEVWKKGCNRVMSSTDSLVSATEVKVVKRNGEGVNEREDAVSVVIERLPLWIETRE